VVHQRSECGSRQRRLAEPAVPGRKFGAQGIVVTKLQRLSRKTHSAIEFESARSQGSRQMRGGLVFGIRIACRPSQLGFEGREFGTRTTTARHRSMSTHVL
jgi:hypothetical protein